MSVSRGSAKSSAACPRIGPIGVPFGWGDWRGMLALVEMTARREGFGDRLAEGACADLVVVDRDLHLQRVIAEGEDIDLADAR